MCQHRRMSPAAPLPGFRKTCLGIAGLHAVPAAGILVRGAEASLAEFEVPHAVLTSPHYDDAIRWVYLHMLVIAAIVALMGLRCEDPRLQRDFSRLMLAASLVYTFLDLRASDSPLGTALYHGPGSLIPVLICLLTALLFARLAFARPAA
jgi:hypothetical protein